MNIDKDLVSRALEDIGEEPLSDEDIKGKASRWLAVKSFYLPTVRETLAGCDWTSRKVRKALVSAAAENLPDGMNLAYTLPADCVRPVSLSGGKEFIAEGAVLYCNVENAVLLYISDGRISDAAKYRGTDDFAEYEELTMDPKLEQTIELRLAAKAAYKIGGKKELADTLYAKSVLAQNEAVQASTASARSARAGTEYWGKTLGLDGGSDADN
jgi:hypothetical protein